MTVSSRLPIQTKNYSPGQLEKKLKDPTKYFHSVAGTCPTKSSHEQTMHSLWDLSPTNSNQFEFVRLVAESKLWSLRLVAGTKVCSLRLVSRIQTGLNSWDLSPTNYAWSVRVNSSWDKSLQLNENISLDLLIFFPVGLENNFLSVLGVLMKQSPFYFCISNIGY